MVERLDIDVGLTEASKNGFEAYNMAVASLSAERENKTDILKKRLDEGDKAAIYKAVVP